MLFRSDLEVEIKAGVEDVLTEKAILVSLVDSVLKTGNCDGILADNIPLDKCWELGCDKVIIVLTRPMDYVRNDHIAPLCRLAFLRYKSLLRTIEQRNNQYNARIHQIRRLEQEGKVFVIRPSENRPVGRLEKDPEKLKALHALGMQDAQKQWQALEEYLAQ